MIARAFINLFIYLFIHNLNNCQGIYLFVYLFLIIIIII